MGSYKSCTYVLFLLMLFIICFCCCCCRFRCCCYCLWFLFTAVSLSNCISQIECFAIFTSISLPISSWVWVCEFIILSIKSVENVNANGMLSMIVTAAAYLTHAFSFDRNWFLNSWFVRSRAFIRVTITHCSLLHFNSCCTFHPLKLWNFIVNLQCMMYECRQITWICVKPKANTNGEIDRVDQFHRFLQMGTTITIKNYTVLYVSELIIICNWEREKKETRCDSHTSKINVREQNEASISFNRKKEEQFAICIIWNGTPFTLCVEYSLFYIKYRLQKENTIRISRMICGRWFENSAHTQTMQNVMH